jgi:hypothetical protein
VTIWDPDGVTGAANPQTLGPIRYSGVRNLALGKAITADPGWGCCSDPSQLVDGRIQNDNWGYGFAWWYPTGPWKQATIDLGAPTTFNRGVVWHHDPSGVPIAWKFQYSNDGSNWTDAYSNTAPVCRDATLEGASGTWYYPACGFDASFPPVTARYFRYTFDDSALFRGLHAWAVEIEVFNSPPANQPPVAHPQSVSTPGNAPLPIVLTGTDPDNDSLTFAIVSGPSHGVLTGTPPNVTYTPGFNFIGTDSFSFKASDGKVDSPPATVSISVFDTTPPVISSPIIVGTAGANGWYTSDVTVSWKASDPESGITSPACSVTISANTAGTLVPCSATNGAGLSSSTSVVVKVDKTRPSVSGMPAAGCTLWPPNDKLVQIATIAASAGVSGLASFSVAGSSNEPADPGPDIVITGAGLEPRTVQLRAQRLGNGSGRVYTLVATTVNSAGVSASVTATCTVPHDQGK